mmetsp:Transcript_48890/g.153568  ORF Transcript_48890/g.153568 Transcript_48890/m.153568 type:complete len:194 (-) Transcript_48890:281-862(-)
MHLSCWDRKSDEESSVSALSPTHARAEQQMTNELGKDSTGPELVLIGHHTSFNESPATSHLTIDQHAFATADHNKSWLRTASAQDESDETGELHEVLGVHHRPPPDVSFPLCSPIMTGGLIPKLDLKSARPQKEEEGRSYSNSSYQVTKTVISQQTSTLTFGSPRNGKSQRATSVRNIRHPAAQFQTIYELAL